MRFGVTGVAHALGGAGVVMMFVALSLLCGVAHPAAAVTGESISAYDTGIEVRADGELRVTETIRYDFGTNERHGILRKIPARFRYDDTRDRLYPIGAVDVTIDGGAKVPVEPSSEDGYEIFKIGDPHGTVTAHTPTPSNTPYAVR
jgi:hypothetical protein